MTDEEKDKRILDLRRRANALCTFLKEHVKVLRRGGVAVELSVLTHEQWDHLRERCEALERAVQGEALREVRYGDWVVVDDGFNVHPFPYPEFTEQSLHYTYRDESNVEIESRRCWGSREKERGMEIWEGWVLYDTEDEAHRGWTED